MNPLLSFIVPFAWAVFAGATLLTVVLGAILAYHWFRYAMNPGFAITSLVVYTVASGFLLFGILAAVIAIQMQY